MEEISRVQLNGSPHDGRRRRSDGLFQRPGSHSRVRRTIQTPANALSTRLDDDDHVDSTPAVGPGSGSSRRPNDSRSCCCPTATSLSADAPWLPSDPASRRSNLRSLQQLPGTAVPSDQWCQLTQDEALLRLTRSHRPGAISLSTHCRAYTQLKTALPLDCSLRCHSLPNTHAFTSTVYSKLILLAKFLRQSLKHVRFTCTKSPDRHTVDLTAIHVPRHSCPHVASENNNETDRLT